MVCRKKEDITMTQFKLTLVLATFLSLTFTAASFAQHYEETDLVSDIPGRAAVTDPNLVNPWGLTRSSTSPWWVSDNGTGLSTLYDGNGTPFIIKGQTMPLVVTIPGPTAGSTGTPTGAVFNGTTDFQLTPGNPAIFIFVTEDGIIAGWNPNVPNPKSTTAVIEVNQSPQSVFKGATIAQVDQSTFLYVADFRKGKIEVFDGNFQPVRLSKGAFGDNALPRGYAPFNVQNIGGNLYVAFALQDSAKHDEVDGPALGFVDVFSPSGKLLMRLQHGDWLNGPWGMTLAPSDFGEVSHQLLVGQFGSGQIAAYNAITGEFIGLLKDLKDKVIAIEGLWSLSFGNGETAGPLNTLFFTAGIHGESHGLFGTLTPVNAELTQGNEQ
jgi:uncharacterized protein (TIGR03118 family)